jgi:VWFA-related protein
MVVFGVLALLTAAAPRASQDNIDLVQLDVVVVDGKGQPIHGLKSDDFTVKQDGRRVDLATFDEVRPQNAEADPRAFVLFLDDAGVPTEGTIVIQQIGKAFLESLRSLDEVSVVRLGVSADEPYGDRRTAEERLLAYRAGRQPFIGYATLEESLQHFANVFHSLAIRDQQRKTVVCIGSPGVCNLEEPTRYAPRSIYPLWIDAMRSSAQANIVVYAVVPGRARLRGGGLAELTGGEVFATTSNIGPAIDRIIRDADNFYLLGFWPGADAKGKGRELHQLDVDVSRRGAKVHVRQRRGE